RRRFITSRHRPLCTFRVAIGLAAARSGMATTGTGRAFKCATDRVLRLPQGVSGARFGGLFFLPGNRIITMHTKNLNVSSAPSARDQSIPTDEQFKAAVSHQ